jgi:hypothetical protein
MTYGIRTNVTKVGTDFLSFSFLFPFFFLSFSFLFPFFFLFSFCFHSVPIVAMWHLPSFRYHFCRGRKIPTNGRPVNCVVAAAWTLLTKIDIKASPVYGCSPPHYASALQLKQKQKQQVLFHHNPSSAAAAAALSPGKALDLFLHGGDEVDNDLTNLHQNLDNLDLSHLDPGHILQYILRSTHCACTGTTKAAAGDPHTHCNCFEPPHVNPLVPVSGHGFGANTNVEPKYPEDQEPGRRECVGHSVFHIDIVEKRTCHTCGATDHPSESTCVNRYLNFVHRVNAERIVQQHTLMSVDHKNHSSSSSSSSNNNNNFARGRHAIQLDQVLHRIIDVHWIRACPKKPLCELCMGRVATSSCLTCDTKYVSDEYFNTRNRAREKTKRMRAEGKEDSEGSGRSGGNNGEVDGDGGGGPGSFVVENGLVISNDHHSAELLEHYERNLAERHAVSLCFQCDRHLHRMSTKFGLHTFQGEELPNKDFRGKYIHCSSCQSDASDTTGGNKKSSSSLHNHDNILQKMYKTDGPIATTESFESETGYRTNKVEKQLYLCERCYDMGLFPPLTKRHQFTEEHENSNYRKILKKKLMAEYLKSAQQLKNKQEQTLVAYDVELDKLRRKVQDLQREGEMNSNSLSKSRMHQQQNQVENLTSKVYSMEEKKMKQVQHYAEQKSRRMGKVKRRVNRKLNAMLKSRRNIMSLTAGNDNTAVFQQRCLRWRLTLFCSLLPLPLLPLLPLVFDLFRPLRPLVSSPLFFTPRPCS